MEEIWKEIPGFEGYYEISNLTRVRSVSRIIYDKKVGIKNLKSRILKPANFMGYRRVLLCYKGQRVNKLVHRLFAQVFIPNPENKPEVNHIDGNRSNNSLENLEWVTHRENMHHSVLTGLHWSKKGEEHFSARLTNIDVIQMRKDRNNGMTYPEISKKYNVTKSTASHACYGTTWSHLNFPPCNKKIYKKRKLSSN
jgi:hypothetical protein